MTTESGVFTCSICGENSRTICAYCTKDACLNHLCERCLRCSDCCECGVPVNENAAVAEEAPAEEPVTELQSEGS